MLRPALLPYRYEGDGGHRYEERWTGEWKIANWMWTVEREDCQTAP